jgi:hypothetical protein
MLGLRDHPIAQAFRAVLFLPNFYTGRGIQQSILCVFEETAQARVPVLLKFNLSKLSGSFDHRRMIR